MDWFAIFSLFLDPRNYASNFRNDVFLLLICMSV